MERGTAERRKAAVKAHGFSVGFRVQKITHGIDNTAVAANHRPTARALLEGQ